MPDVTPAPAAVGGTPTTVPPLHLPGVSPASPLLSQLRAALGEDLALSAANPVRGPSRWHALVQGTALDWCDAGTAEAPADARADAVLGAGEGALTELGDAELADLVALRGPVGTEEDER